MLNEEDSIANVLADLPAVRQVVVVDNGSTDGTARVAREGGAEVGLEQSLELLAKMRAHVDGTYIMPSFGRYEQSAELVRRVRSELLDAEEKVPVLGDIPVVALYAAAGLKLAELTRTSEAVPWTTVLILSAAGLALVVGALFGGRQD